MAFASHRQQVFYIFRFYFSKPILKTTLAIGAEGITGTQRVSLLLST